MWVPVVIVTRVSEVGPVHMSLCVLDSSCMLSIYRIYESMSLSNRGRVLILFASDFPGQPDLVSDRRNKAISYFPRSPRCEAYCYRAKHHTVETPPLPPPSLPFSVWCAHACLRACIDLRARKQYAYPRM